jgi:hypothetical protein
MALSATQITDMQGDLGITSDQAVFTDAELNRLYERSDSDYNGAVYLAWRQLLADSAKFYNYTVGQTRIERAQTFKNVQAMADLWRDEARSAGNEVLIVGLSEIPPRSKEQPETSMAEAHGRARWNSDRWYQ